MSDVSWQDTVAGDQRRWLVTGVAGFVGSHLASRLLRLGQEVVGLDDFSTGHPANLDALQSEVDADAWSKFRLVEGDIRNLSVCQGAAEGVDFVMHQAALGSVPRSMEHPHNTHTVNVDGTLNVLLAALERRVQKVVYASSSSVYGDEPGLPKVEGRTGLPLSPYAATKQIGELYANTLWRTHGLASIGLRYFNVIGTRQDPSGPYAAVVPRWLAALRSGQQPVIYGDGETSRDFCPVGNVVQANIRAALSSDVANGNVYNVALGGQTTLTELFYSLRDAVSKSGVDCGSIEPVYQDFRPGDIRHSLADISAAAADFGYAPDISLQEGLRLIV
jgi:UDP-N-acetylglucosamine 4-epimerase